MFLSYSPFSSQELLLMGLWGLYGGPLNQAWVIHMQDKPFTCDTIAQSLDMMFFTFYKCWYVFSCYLYCFILYKEEKIKLT